MQSNFPGILGYLSGGGAFLFLFMYNPKILYCHCQYAQVLPKEVKEAVLQRLCDSDVEFEAVADLCELSARRDPLLKQLSEGGGLKIAACFPRAVKWLFAAAGAPLDPALTEVVNLRTEPALAAATLLLDSPLTPNLQPAKTPAPPDQPLS